MGTFKGTIESGLKCSRVRFSLSTRRSWGPGTLPCRVLLRPAYILEIEVERFRGSSAMTLSLSYQPIGTRVFVHARRLASLRYEYGLCLAELSSSQLRRSRGQVRPG